MEDAFKLDERALRLLSLVVDAIWEEAQWMLSLTPLQSERWHKMRQALHLRKYDEFPDGEVKDFLPRYLPILREALGTRAELEKWSRFIQQPEVVERLAGLQEEVQRKLGEHG